MRIIRSSLSGVIAFAIVLTPMVASAERAEPRSDTWPDRTLSIETIIKNHVAALGGEKLLRAGTSLTFTVSGEKMGKKFTKIVVQARPNKMRVDVQADDGPMSKGFDGKVAWLKKGDAKAEAMSAEDTASMAMHAQFEEPLLDYAKKGTAVNLIGDADVNGTPAYDLEVTFKGGEVEHHFLDASTFLLIKRTFAGKDKDGKATVMSVRFGDYKKVQGRMVNHSVEWDSDDGKVHKSVVSKIAFNKKFAATIFAMPK
jgi:hypothetical protein